MSDTKTPTKEQILEAIKKLEKNPHDKIGILSDIGIGVVGAAGAGYAASIFGASLFFGLIPVAAPLAVVAGGAALGGLALVGVKKMFIDGTFDDGKKAEMLKQLKEQLMEMEAKERASKLEDSDKAKFILLLKEPVRLDLISLKDAQNLMANVENGQVPLKEAYKLVQDLIKSAPTGGLALVGVKKMFIDGTFDDGKKAEMLKQLKEQLREAEAKERASKLEDSDKTKFILLLKEPVRLDLISPKDAQNLMANVENGQVPLKEAYKLVQDLIKSAPTR
ncbi:hypothetical protein [Microcoleus sp. FACHB-68]|uniref:hypothetical protein n=1 Tax=Microcoleus sp. FACHB-68 TaxID=2692826 RepID=UPI001687AAD9|nr:hypothetical protein [Microcoleus sp. FACHB-68]MBD1940555.1 hypothetical protein [Microcoleus sp. FACHB-68]